MRRTIIAVLAAALLLTGCTARERMVYTSNVVDISRSGRQICVVSHADGKEYTFTLARVRRDKNTPTVERKLLETDTFTITAAGSLWIVEMPKTKVYIKW